MLNIGDYSANVRLILTEGSKYFVLLILSILAIRLWQRWGRVSPAGRTASMLVVACLATALAGITGYVSMRQSLAIMDYHYGMKAFDEGHLPQALSLFEASERNWQSGDTMGCRGVCLLLLGEGGRGLAVLLQARTMRKGEGTPFEFIYEGLYRFAQGDAPGAKRFLRAAAKDPTYQWTATKTIAVIELDEQQVAAAAEDMKPFIQLEVRDFDQAYVMAALKLASGNRAEARALLEKFPGTNLGPKWQSRFEQLRARLQD